MKQKSFISENQSQHSKSVLRKKKKKKRESLKQSQFEQKTGTKEEDLSVPPVTINRKSPTENKQILQVLSL